MLHENATEKFSSSCTVKSRLELVPWKSSNSRSWLGAKLVEKISWLGAGSDANRFMIGGATSGCDTYGVSLLEKISNSAYSVDTTGATGGGAVPATSG